MHHLEPVMSKEAKAQASYRCTETLQTRPSQAQIGKWLNEQLSQHPQRRNSGGQRQQRHTAAADGKDSKDDGKDRDDGKDKDKDDGKDDGKDIEWWNKGRYGSQGHIFIDRQALLLLQGQSRVLSSAPIYGKLRL